MRLPRIALVGLAVIVVLTWSAPANAANCILMEIDEADGWSQLAGADGMFSIWSPYRTAGGGNAWLAISSTYNKPRSSSIHRGVDILGAEGRPVYTVHGNQGSGDPDVAAVAETGWHQSIYGNYVKLMHLDYVNGAPYYYGSFYCHLQTVSVGWGQQLNYNTSVGLTGNTPGPPASTGPHLHLEIWSYGSSTPRRYAPYEFYRRPNEAWAHASSFVTRLPDSGNTVQFRVVGKSSNGQDVLPASVELVWRLGPFGSWQTPVQMNEESTGIYYYDLGSLGSVGQEVQFYIRAVDGLSGTTAYRPWRHTDFDPPQDRPFVKHIQ